MRKLVAKKWDMAIPIIAWDDLIDRLNGSETEVIDGLKLEAHWWGELCQFAHPSKVRCRLAFPLLAQVDDGYHGVTDESWVDDADTMCIV